MFAPTRYITWAFQFYGQVPFDLASSGIPYVAWKDVGAELGPVDDFAVHPRLREAIARYNDVPASEVVPALGTSHAIFLAYAALLSPGDEILVEHPGYEPLTRAAEGLGASVRSFERRARERFAIDPDRVAAAIGPRTRAIVITTLHNPTGVGVPDATILELSKIGEARGAYVIVDEVYAPFEGMPADDGVFRRSARKLAPNVIAIGSLTKCYGLGMHRIGWVLGPEEIVERARSAMIATIGQLPTTHAAYGCAALASVPKLAVRAKTLLGEKKALVERWLAAHPRATWSAPAHGLFGLVTIEGAGELLPRIEERARVAGVLVGAGTFFGAPESFRLSWATCEPTKLEEGLRLLEPLVG